MEIKIETSWISAKDFETQNPLIGTIKSVAQEKNKWGNLDTIVTLLVGIEEKRKTLYREDLIVLCGLYSTNTDKWLGKQLRLEKALNPKTQKSLIKVIPL